MDEKLMEAGEIVYGTHAGNLTESEELLEKLREIDDLKARLAELNEIPKRNWPLWPGAVERFMWGTSA